MRALQIFLVFSFFLFTGISGKAQGTWKRVSSGTDKSLNSVYFTDSLYGWTVGDSGTILHTSDGGKSWVFQESQTGNDIVSVFFLDRKLGWATSLNYKTAPYGTVVLKTTNGGFGWISSTYPGNDIFMNCIFFLDSLNGWMGGSPHAIVRTRDGGNSWEIAETDTSVLAFFPVLNIRFYDQKHGYACGGMHDIAGVTWSTHNGGELWQAIDASEAPADEVNDLYLFDSLHVMGAGGDPDFGYGVGMIRTLDGGINWDYRELGFQGYATDLEFRTQNEAWAPLGPGRKLIYSTDTGTTWKDLPTPDSLTILRITFPDSLHGFAVGRNGAIIMYQPVTSGFTDPSQLQDDIPIAVYQNYPNPFNSGTRIRFAVSARNGSHQYNLELKVFNSLGDEVLVPVCDDFQPGEYSVDIGAVMAPGIYYYRMYGKVPGEPVFSTAPKKMVVVR